MKKSNGERRKTILGYTLAAVLVPILVLLKMSFGVGNSPFLMYLAAVMASASVGGLGPGLAATLLSALSIDFFFFPPFYSFAPSVYNLPICIFIVEGVLISWLAETLKGATRKYQAAVRAKDDLLAVVSHDLKNPLGVVHGTAALLRELLPPEVAAEPMVAESLDAIGHSTAVMRDLITDLLDSARMESEGLAVKREVTQLAPVFNEAIQLLKPLALEKGIDLQRVFPAVPVYSACDRGRILQVLSNLIGNAIKFTPARGRIVVTLAALGGEVVGSVRDSGPGIARNQVPHLFERFWKGGKAGHGTGLGLYIAKRIVDSHGGRIWVDSAPGAGATFAFALPSAPPPEAAGLALPVLETR